MVHDTAYGEGLGMVPPQGGPQADREATLERMGQSLSLSPDKGRDGGSRLERGGELRLPLPEHIHTVYCDKDHYGHVSDIGAGSG